MRPPQPTQRGCEPPNAKYARAASADLPKPTTSGDHKSLMAASHPITPAIRALRAANVSFEPLLFDYRDKGGTAHSSAQLGWEERRVIKTLIVKGVGRDAYVILMHGDRQLSLRGLGRVIGIKSLDMADPALVNKLTGYQIGGVSPFGIRHALPIYAQQSIRSLDRIAINGGKRGFLVSLTPDDLSRVLNPRWVDVAAGV